MRHIFAIMIVALFLFYPSHGFTKVQEIVSEGAYNMGDGETPSVAESRALLQAKRIALEQAGTYVESYTKVENLELTKDEIQVLTSGIMEVEILDKKRTVVGDGFRFWVKIKARVNPDNIKEMANKIKVKDKSFVDDYKKIQEAYDKSQKDIEELKKQLAQAKGEKEKKQVEAKISDDERMFQANEWFEKGRQYTLNDEHDKAIEAYTSAITLNPKFVKAYLERSFMYWSDSKMDKAFQDVKDAILINPNYIDAYYRLEFYYSAMALTSDINEEKDKSIFYQNKRIEVCNKVIELQPKDPVAYLYRGKAYKEIGEYDKALRDFNQIIIGQLHPYPIVPYVERGNVYYEKGQYTKAIDDYTNAINAYENYYENYIKPNNIVPLVNVVVEPFVMRGYAYHKLGNIKMATSDFQKACDMGDKIGCDNLQKVLQTR